VTFHKGGEFADIFEFFAERDGSPRVTLAEAEDWLRKELVDLPRRHSHGLTDDP